jgi:hypothetical protein
MAMPVAVALAVRFQTCRGSKAGGKPHSRVATCTVEQSIMFTVGAAAGGTEVSGGSVLFIILLLIRIPSLAD